MSAIERCALRLYAHEQMLRDLKSSRGQCEREFAATRSGEISVEPCWKRKVKIEDECMAEDIRFYRSELVETFCPACQRNEKIMRQWYDARRATGAYRAALTMACRRRFDKSIKEVRE